MSHPYRRKTDYMRRTGDREEPLTLPWALLLTGITWALVVLVVAITITMHR